jgi:hypothetical protein
MGINRSGQAQCRLFCQLPVRQFPNRYRLSMKLYVSEKLDGYQKRLRNRLREGGGTGRARGEVLIQENTPMHLRSRKEL